MPSLITTPVTQIILLAGYEPRYSNLNVLVFDATGKHACKAFFDRLLEDLKQDQYIYFRDTNYRTTPPFTYEDSFHRLKGNLLVPARTFEEADFYEISFYTSDLDRQDVGIVLFISYSITNSGVKLVPTF